MAEQKNGKQQQTEVSSIQEELTSVDERLIALAINGVGCAKEIFKKIKSSSDIDGWENQEIFSATQDVFSRQKPKPMLLDKLDIKEELKIRGTYTKISESKIERILNTIPERKTVHQTIDTISRRSLKKEMDSKFQELSNSGADSVEKIAIEIAELAKRKGADSTRQLLTIDEIFDEVEHIEEMPDCVTTGFPTLDERLGGGLVKGNYHVLCAPTGSGKSILTISMWKNMLDAGIRTVYVNYEIPRSVFFKYLFAQFTGLNVMHRGFVDPMLLQKKKEEFRVQVEKLFDENLLMLADPMQGASKMWNDVEYMLRDLAETSQPECIFFDTINSVYAKTGTSSQGARWNEYEFISISAEHFTTETNIAMVFTAQPGQDAMKREDKTPQLYDVAGGKTISEKAASIIHLHRTDVFDPSRRIDYSELHVTKNRVMGQEMGSIPIRVKYNKDYKNLVELDKSSQGLPIETFDVELPPHPIFGLDGENL